ncbi:MAG: hypothetical protein EHM36_14580 [Deltaproteobacteria bacterium]|nr:MAG: hypothetical protein EHM36_14580 [Deltaproteobacteria bacterium]
MADTDTLFSNKPGLLRRTTDTDTFFLDKAREDAMNDIRLMDRPEVGTQGIQLGSISDLADVIAKLGHKLNNHLTSVLGYSELLSYEINDPGLKAELGKIVEEAKKASQIVRELCDLVRQPEKAAEAR